MRERTPRYGLPPVGADDELMAPRGPSLVDWGQLVLRAAWRRKWLAAAVFVLCVGALAVYYGMKTPMYRVEARILTQRQQALPSSLRQQAPDELPTRSAWDVVHQRGNLIALIKEADLVPKSGTDEPKDGFLEKLQRAVSALIGDSRFAGSIDDPMDKLLLRLDRALVVSASEGTITVSIYWPDPEQAYRVVEGAVQNFLEERHLQEVTAIDEVISLLQGRVVTLQGQLDKVIEETRRAAARGEAARLPALLPAPPQPAQPNEELVRLKSLLDSKERAIADVEDFRRRRLADLQAQLDAQRGVYSEAHPSIITLRLDIQALSRESPQIATLRDEAEKLRKEYAARLAQGGRQGTSAVPHAPISGPQVSIDDNERVRSARFQYQQMVERVNAAQIDLDSARAAFKYRYKVIWPAEVPKTPESHKPTKIALGVFASLVLAILAAAGTDLRSGRVEQRWQVERSLDLPILGEVGRE